MLWAAIGKGIWYDEAWSSWAERHDIGLADLWRQRWAPDVHPPLFFFLSWLVEPLTGDSIVPKRLLNLVPLALGVSSIAYMGCRWRENWIVVTAVFGAASTALLDTFADHRMYFAFLVALFVCCVGMAILERSENDYSCEDRGLAVILAAAIIVGFNLQYICTLFFGVILSTFIMRHVFGGKLQWAVRLIAAAAIGSALVVTAGLLQWPAARETVTHFWAHSTFGTAVSFIAAAAVFSLAPYAAAMVVIALHPREGARWRYRFAATAALSVLLALLIGLLLNAVRPFILRHYLLFLGPPLIVALAVLAAPILQRRRAWAYVILANALVALALLGYRRAHQPQASELAEIAAETVRACPSTQVVAAGHWQVSARSIRPFSTEPGATAWLYQLLSQGRGFRLTSAKRWRSGDRCPTIVWVENADIQPTAAEVAAALKLPLAASSIGAAKIRTGSAGFAVLYPAGRG